MTARARGPHVLGIPVASWTFALRTWGAMMAALYIAFWLQLPSGDVGAVTVGILAVPTRGPTLSKAILRVGGTAIGMLASVVLAALFDQTSTLFLGALALWLAGCTYVAGLLDDEEAYVALLSGYTVAIVALPNIDTPLSTFASALDRGASIVLALVVLAVAETLPAAPASLPGLRSRLAALRLDVREATIASLAGRVPDAAALAALCGRVTALRAGARALPVESIAGRIHAAAARRALASLAAEIWEGRRLADTPPPVRSRLAAALALPRERAVAPRPSDRDSSASPDLLACDAAVEDAMRSLVDGRGTARGPALPVARPARAAAKNAMRVLLIFAFASVFYVLSGIPQTTDGLLHVAIYICISMLSPAPRVYALATVLATAVAIVAVGVTEFMILDGVDAFPLLAIGLFPMVVGAGLLRADRNALRSAMGTRILVFSIFILLSPGLSQSYDPQRYLSESLEVLVGAFIFAVGSVVVLPASPEARRGWLLDAARGDLAATLAGRGGTDVESAYRWADIAAQTGRLARMGGPGAEAALDEASRLADAAWRARRGASPGRSPPSDA